jgi:hypothetical protein
MSRFRSPWLALFGSATLIVLSLSSALGARPEAGTNRGQQVSTFVHSLQGDTEEPTEEEPTEEESPAEEPTTDDSAASDHGTCVAAVAQDKEAVGPPNDNHGGAVSEAARVTCWDGAAPDETNTEEPTEDTGDSEVESEADDADDAEAEADSSAGHAHGHSGEHGGSDSSDD